VDLILSSLLLLGALKQDVFFASSIAVLQKLLMLVGA
jgi:hypothetical protein